MYLCMLQLVSDCLRTFTQTISYEGTNNQRHCISVPNVLMETWFKQDLQKLVCEVLSADVHKVTEGKHNGNL